MEDMTVNCGECRNLLQESPSLTAGERKPCPSCGSLLRSIEVNFHETIRTHVSFSVKGKEIDEKKPFIEEKSRDSLHNKTGKWMKRKMIIDRRNNKYMEEVIDPITGETIHFCDEPLSEHFGHGSAQPDIKIDDSMFVDEIEELDDQYTHRFFMLEEINLLSSTSKERIKKAVLEAARKLNKEGTDWSLFRIVKRVRLELGEGPGHEVEKTCLVFRKPKN